MRAQLKELADELSRDPTKRTAYNVAAELNRMAEDKEPEKTYFFIRFDVYQQGAAKQNGNAIGSGCLIVDQEKYNPVEALDVALADAKKAYRGYPGGVSVDITEFRRV